MTSSVAVATAAMMQCLLGVSFFIEQNPDLCSTAPNLASWLFLIGFLDILLDVHLYPVRYMHLPYLFQVVADIVMAELLTEFATLIVWCTIEKICCKLCKTLLLIVGLKPSTYFKWEYYILGVATTAISLSFLLCVGHATDHWYILRKKSIRIYRKFGMQLKQLWLKCRETMSNKLWAVRQNSCPLSNTYELSDDERNESEANAYVTKSRSGRYQRRRRSRNRNYRYN